MFRRLRDEAPLYYNGHYDFFTLSRFETSRVGVPTGSTYISGKGSVLGLIKSGMEIPPGRHLFEDPPAHDMHRGLLGRVFTPRRIARSSPGAGLLRPRLDPLARARRIRLDSRPGGRVPMRAIGSCSAFPKRTRRRSATRSTGMRLEEGEPPCGEGRGVMDGGSSPTTSTGEQTIPQTTS